MIDLDENLTEQWESGQLGRDEACVSVASAEVEARVNQATAMKLVTMRLPVNLIEALKFIAQHHGIAYQPMIRDLLGRFAVSEYKKVMIEHAQALAESAEDDATAPVESFMSNEREPIRACG